MKDKPRHHPDTGVQRRKVTPKTANGTRTLGQGTLAAALVALLGTFVNLSEQQIGLLLVVVTAVLSFAQTAYEDWSGRAFLRDVPEPDRPVVDKP